MLDIGWSELILIGVVALIVIGPKDLPDMFRQLGRFTAKMRSMAREFSRAMEQAANESGVKDVAKDLKSVTSPHSLGLNAMKDAAAKFEKWDPLKNAATPTKAPAAVSAATPVVTGTKPPLGPATQALLDQQAARQAIVAESTERMRALNGAGHGASAAAPAVPAASAAPAVPAASAAPATSAATTVFAHPAQPKPRPKASKPTDFAAQPAAPKASAKSDLKSAPKTPAKRKTKKADEA